VRGALINTATVLVGGTLGTLTGNRFPDRYRSLLLQAIGLMTIVIGLQRALETRNILILLGSVVLGGIVGEALHVERRLQDLAAAMTQRMARPADPPTLSQEPEPSSVAHAFVTSSLIFCVGPMTVLGSIEDGLSGAFQTLAIKATLDGVTSAVLAASLGWGVILSAATVLIFQGALTLGAGLVRGLLTDPMVIEMTAAGGLLILGIGLNMLQLSKIPVGNLLPALAIAPALVALAQLGALPPGPIASRGG
jgi:uncharacterized protein